MMRRSATFDVRTRDWWREQEVKFFFDNAPCLVSLPGEDYPLQAFYEAYRIYVNGTRIKDKTDDPDIRRRVEHWERVEIRRLEEIAELDRIYAWKGENSDETGSQAE